MKPGQDSKSVNVILSNNDGASGYGNLFTVLSVCQSTDWWVDTGPIFMCVLMCLCFLAAYKYEIHRDAQLDFSGTAQNVQMVRVLHNNDGASGYGNLFTVLPVCESTDWWVDTGANIHVCADVYLFHCSI